MINILKTKAFANVTEGMLTEEQCQLLGIEYSDCEPLYYVKLCKLETDVLRNFARKFPYLCMDDDNRPNLGVVKGLIVFKDHPDYIRNVVASKIESGTLLWYAFEHLMDIYYMKLE